jgi:hypothetical protein
VVIEAFPSLLESLPIAPDHTERDQVVETYGRRRAAHSFGVRGLLESLACSVSGSINCFNGEDSKWVASISALACWPQLRVGHAGDQ